MSKLVDVVTGLAADGTPDGAADYVMTYDNSATTLKKVLLNNLPGAGGSGDMTWAAILASQLTNEIKGWPPCVNTGDLAALKLWWDSVSTPSTAPSVVAVSGEGITETYELALKCVADGANEGLSQRWTYADEPRIKSGRALSSLWAIWCVGGVGVTAKLVNSSAEETAAAKVTAAAWTIVEIPNHTLAGTYVDIQLLADGAGTFYAVPLGANIGARGVPLAPRGGRLVDTYVQVVTSGDSNAAFVTVDTTAASSPLAFALVLGCTGSNGARNGVPMLVRRKGDTGTAKQIAFLTTLNGYYYGSTVCACDDAQEIEYKQTSEAGDTEDNYLDVLGYWEWE